MKSPPVVPAESGMPWQDPPQVGEPSFFDNMMGNPMLMMGLGVLGAGAGNPMQNIARGMMGGLSLVDRYRKDQEDRELREWARKQGPGPTAAMRNYEYLVQQGMDPQQARDAVFRTGTTVNVGQQGGTQFGSIPSGYQRITDPETGAVRDVPIEGSPDYQKRMDRYHGTLDAIAKINRMKVLIDKYGSESGVGIGEFGTDPAVTGEMEQLYSGIVADIAKLRDLGVLQPGELENIEARLTDPSSFGAHFTRDKRILAQYNTLLQQYQTRLKRYAPPSTSTPPAGGGSDLADPLGIR